MSKFLIGADTSATIQSPVTYNDYSDSDNEDTLPYPGELPRKDFLTANFNPQTYLSTLRNRHQTLEDLRTDLRQRSQLLTQELLDLVNNNYEEFLSLGADLKGGEDHVEGVKLGLLGFEREIGSIQRVVTERRVEVGHLLSDRKKVRGDIILGRELLAIDRAIGELEATLGVVKKDDESTHFDWEELDADDDNGQDELTLEVAAVRKHQRRTEEFIILSRQIGRLPSEHPFLQTQSPRIEQLKRTLLLDLRAALQQVKAAKADDLVLAVLRLYASLDAEADGIKALKNG